MADLPQTLAQLASYYAGRPVTIASPTVRLMGNQWGNVQGETTQDGRIFLNPTVMDALSSMVGQLQTKQASLGALQTLIHEAIHNRQDTGSGAKSWSDEWQAPAMGAQLLPDALQRFFGIKFSSPLGQYYYQQAKALHPFGAPNQQYQDLAGDHAWTGHF